MRGVSEVGHGDVAFTVVRNLLLIIFKGSHQKNTKFLHCPKRGGEREIEIHIHESVWH